MEKDLVWFKITINDNPDLKDKVDSVFDLRKQVREVENSIKQELEPILRKKLKIGSDYEILFSFKFGRMAVAYRNVGKEKRTTGQNEIEL